MKTLFQLYDEKTILQYEYCKTMPTANILLE